MSPNRRLSGFLREKWLCWDAVILFSLPEVFGGPQICQKCVGGRGFAPDPAGKAHNAHPGPLVGWVGDTPSPIPTPSALSAPRFSRFRRSASVPLNVKSWLRP